MHLKQKNIMEYKEEKPASVQSLQTWGRILPRTGVTHILVFPSVVAWRRD